MLPINFLRFLALFMPVAAQAQLDLITPFKECNSSGSTTVYDYKNKNWVFSDSADSKLETLPASTFKIINLLVALETHVIHDENDVIKWVGQVDTVRYGYRPDIYRDMTIKEAFEHSAGWVFIELAKRIGRERYRQYLTKAHYGNGQLTEAGADFWNFGAFGISPINQVNFLKAVYEARVPFSKRNLKILKRVMVTENTATYTLRSKTGWTREGGFDTGWWVGYVERKNNVYFFATRLLKSRQTINADFGECRKEITRDILRQLQAL